MKTTTQKGRKLYLHKGIITLFVIGLLSFHVSQVYAGQDPYAIPENWPSDWVAPFADEAKVAVPEVAQPVVPTSDAPAKYSKLVVATAYSSEVRQTDARPFAPAMRMDFRDEVAEKGGVYCIANNDLRLGTQVRFPDLQGNTVYTVCDRMNARYTGHSRVDFYFYVIGQDGKIDSAESLAMAKANARTFGVKRVKMEVL